MQSLLECMMRQADKVEEFKKHQRALDSLHAKYSARWAILYCIFSSVMLETRYSKLNVEEVITIEVNEDSVFFAGRNYP